MSGASPRLAHAAGFTLLELMIVLAILAILAAVAYPSYQAQVLKARRSDATATLMNLAQALERCYTESNDYTAPSCPSFPQDSPEGHYTINAAVSASTYLLRATPKAGSSQAKDETCAVFTLDHTLRQQARDKGGADTTGTCW